MSEKRKLLGLSRGGWVFIIVGAAILAVVGFRGFKRFRKFFY